MDYAAIEDKYGSSSFQKFPVTIVRGSGSLVWDERGTQYLDFMAGYGVAIVGHCNPRVVEAIRTQAASLITCHGSFYNDVRSRFIEKLVSVTPSGLEGVVLTNSGAESVEAAIKLARRYTGRTRIVSMKGGYHGKTYGALSATWNKKYRDPFAPLLSGFDFVEYGDVSSLDSAIKEDAAAVIAEPIQGESGIVVPPRDYFMAVREICDKRGVLLILDEIQTGLGRTGKMWAQEHWGVTPDIMTIAKGLGGGVPLGAVAARPDVISSLQKGEHTSTFAGNPLACAAGFATLDFIEENGLPEQAMQRGALLSTGLNEIAAHHKIVKEVRGLGMMLAIELRFEVPRLLNNAILGGLILAYSGRNTVRLLPPVVTTDEQLKQGLAILESVISAEEQDKMKSP